MFTDDVPKAVIDWFGLQILEPVTVVTNFILAIVAFVLFRRLRKEGLKSWSYVLLCVGISAAMGMVTHGIYTQIGKTAYITIWVILNCVLAGSLLFMEIASVSKLIKSKLLQYLLVTKWLATCGFLGYLQHLNVSKYNMTIGIIIVLVTQVVWLTKGNKASWLIIGGVAIILLGGVLQSIPVVISALWFNHNDLAHVVHVFAIFLLYKGAMKLNPSPS